MILKFHLEPAFKSYNVEKVSILSLINKNNYNNAESATIYGIPNLIRPSLKQPSRCFRPTAKDNLLEICLQANACDSIIQKKLIIYKEHLVRRDWKSCSSEVNAF